MSNKSTAAVLVHAGYALEHPGVWMKSYGGLTMTISDGRSINGIMWEVQLTTNCGEHCYSSEGDAVDVATAIAAADAELARQLTLRGKAPLDLSVSADPRKFLPPDYERLAGNPPLGYSKRFFEDFDGSGMAGYRVDVVHANGKFYIVCTDMDDPTKPPAMVLNGSNDPHEVLATLYALEIVEDIVSSDLDVRASGLPLSNCKSYGELHDFCDANCLGGCCEDDSWWSQFVGTEDIDILDAAQCTVGRWLEDGKLREFTDYITTVCEAAKVPA